jgi:N-glycosylase/DNA lyase
MVVVNSYTGENRPFQHNDLLEISDDYLSSEALTLKASAIGIMEGIFTKNEIIEAVASYWLSGERKTWHGEEYTMHFDTGEILGVYRDSNYFINDRDYIENEKESLEREAEKNQEYTKETQSKLDIPNV